MTLLISLSEHEAPSMPNEYFLNRMLVRINKKIGSRTKDPMLTRDGLEHMAQKLLDQVADPPSCGPLQEALSDSVRDWLASQTSQSWTKVIVLPPCDEKDFVGEWARSVGHKVLSPPQRHELTVGDFATRHNLDGAGLLVIPRLECWFLRQRNGLNAIRSLLAQLAVLERHCLISCNSWAWAFLVKATGMDIMLPEAQTFAAFDAERLRHWFAGPTNDGASEPLTFRLARTGEDVLETDDDDALRNGYLQQLATHSLGIPWIAWHLWRASLCVRTDSDELPERAAQASSEDARTVWVVELDDCKLPQAYEHRSLLALQALLIHGALTTQELEIVLPATGEPDVMPALFAAGLVQPEAGLFRVPAVAYPAVRQALQAAGFPLGVM